MKAAWKYKYDYQAASWIVYRGSRRLYDYFPTKEDAQTAARNMTMAEKANNPQALPMTGEENP